MCASRVLLLYFTIIYRVSKMKVAAEVHLPWEDWVGLFPIHFVVGNPLVMAGQRDVYLKMRPLGVLEEFKWSWIRCGHRDFKFPYRWLFAGFWLYLHHNFLRVFYVVMEFFIWLLILTRCVCRNMRWKEVRFVNRVRVRVKMVFVYLDFRDILMWYEIMEADAMHAVRLVSTSFADDVVGMCGCFCVFVWAAPEERLELYFVWLRVIHKVQEKDVVADCQWFCRNFSIVVVFVILKSFQDVGGCIFVLLSDFIDPSL